MYYIYIYCIFHYISMLPLHIVHTHPRYGHEKTPCSWHVRRLQTSPRRPSFSRTHDTGLGGIPLWALVNIFGMPRIRILFSMWNVGCGKMVGSLFHYYTVIPVIPHLGGISSPHQGSDLLFSKNSPTFLKVTDFFKDGILISYFSVCNYCSSVFFLSASTWCLTAFPLLICASNLFKRNSNLLNSWVPYD